MTISEVSKKYDISADTLRYYERVGLIPPVTRNASGNRDFNETDCGWIHFIKCLRNAGVSIESLIDYVKMFQKGDSTISARKQLLIEEYDALTERINELITTQQRLKMKIDTYENNLLLFEKNLKK